MGREDVPRPGLDAASRLHDLLLAARDTCTTRTTPGAVRGIGVRRDVLPLGLDPAAGEAVAFNVSDAPTTRSRTSCSRRSDADGDGKLDYAELATGLVDEETTEYLQELGIKDAVALMERLDGGGGRQDRR